MTVEEKLAEMGLSLPDAPAPAANYVPFVQTGSLLHVSGQLPNRDGSLMTGKLGRDANWEEGSIAARACALALLAQVRAACDGDLSRLRRVVKLVGFVNSTPEFTDQPKVVNGASDLLADVLGDRGRHARSAVSAAALPFNVMVEIEGIFEVQ